MTHDAQHTNHPKQPTATKPSVTARRSLVKSSLLQALIFLFIGLWVATGARKLFDFAAFQKAMIDQPFDDRAGIALAYSIPALELGVAALLLFHKTTKIALWASLALLSAYSAYIALVLQRVWGFVPCGCTLEFDTDWKGHLWINAALATLLILAIIGTKYSNSKTTENTTSEPKPEAGLAKGRCLPKDIAG